MKLLLYPYQFASSLGLAVILLITSATTFALGTFIEAAYGTPTGQFFVYETWWFNLLMVMLAVNIFCAAAIRFPWKRYQTGFVITHIGLLTLIFGMALGRLGGIDAQISIFEHEAAHWAFDRAPHFKMVIEPRLTEEDLAKVEKGEADAKVLEGKTITIPFAPGPFNWEDYQSNLAVLFNISGRTGAGDVLYNQDGVKLEVLDYYSDSRPVSAPYLELEISLPDMPPMMAGMTPPPEKKADPKEPAKPKNWQPVSLAVRRARDAKSYPQGIPDSQNVGGGVMMLSASSGKNQTYSFLHSAPEYPLGDKGQVVLCVNEQLTRVSVAEKLNQGRFPLTGSDLEAEIVAHNDPLLKYIGNTQRPTEEILTASVTVQIFRKDEKVGQLLLAATHPELNQFDYKNQVFGDYWCDYDGLGFAERSRLGVFARIEFMQGDFPEGDDALPEAGPHQAKVYYRYWNRKEIVVATEFPLDGSKEKATDAFRMLGDQQLQMYARRFISAKEPQQAAAPKPFERERQFQDFPAARVRLTVDDKSEVFWMMMNLESPDSPPTTNLERHLVETKTRTVSLTMPREAVDIGFRVKLVDFERKLDPGTSQASHFSSTVDFLDLKQDRMIRSVQLPDGPARKLSVPCIRPTRMAVNPKTDRVYYYDADTSAILSAPLDGSKPPEEIVHGVNLNSPGSLAIDPEAGVLYWTDVVHIEKPELGVDNEFGVVRRCRLDGEALADTTRFVDDATVDAGQEYQAIVVADRQITSLAIDAQAKKLYWLYDTVLPPSGDQRSQKSSVVGRSDLDGQNFEDRFAADLGVARGLVIVNEKMYWYRPTSNQIRERKLDGTGAGDVVFIQKDDLRIESLAVDAEAGGLYWLVRDMRPHLPEEGKGLPPRRDALMFLDQAKGGDAVVLCDSTLDRADSLVIDPASGAAYWLQTAVMDTDVWITMNAPVDISDPHTKRSFRLFQEQLRGPFKPGDFEFAAKMPRGETADELYASILTVNYDPGRGFRSAGCLLVVAGISIMFFMRAYFFTPTKPRKTNLETSQQEPGDLQKGPVRDREKSPV
ncbi:hypothetical protein [Lignipirellula cremea]|nr:hypothetical protein [Lignipirellula cremea]